MRTFPIDEGAAWYRGSPLELHELAQGSTITQWKELAEAFSRKPTCLQYDEIYGTIRHNGTEKGRLYIIDEPIKLHVDIHPHPRSTMDEGVEWVTDKPLMIKQVL